MAPVLGCDYSWEVPTAEQIKSVGYTFAMRYLSWEPSKNLKPLELLALHSLGLGVGLVWESTANRALSGAAGGAVDGAAAGAQARALNVPASVPLFWAFDDDDRGYYNPMPTLRAYGNAFAHASGHFAFPYGSSRVIDYFGAGWQTEAWSGSYVSPHAYLYQRAGGARIPGTDENVLFNSYALWLPQSKPPVPTTPALPPDWDQAAVDAYLRALAAAAAKPSAPVKMTATGYPNITGNDHAHARALAELKRKLKILNPKVDVSTDAATLKAVEQTRLFLKIPSDGAGSRVGDNFWRTLNYLTSK